MNLRVIGTCGMSRSGTNYINYLFFLNPLIKGLGHMPVADTTGQSNLGNIRNWRQLWEFWHRVQGSKPLPYYGGALRDENHLFEEYHHEQNRIRRGFEGVCFKADGGEAWFKNVFSRFEGKALILYSVRYPIVNLYEAWKRWGGHEGVTPESFLKNLYNSVKCAEILKNQAGGKWEFLPISISDSHEEIVGRLKFGMKLVGLEMTEMQHTFLEKRRPLAVNISNRQREKTDEELMEELHKYDPKIDQWDVRYKLLLEDHRWKTT